MKISAEYLWNDADTGSSYWEKTSWSNATLATTYLYVLCSEFEPRSPQCEAE